MIRRHDRGRVDPARIDDPQPKLALGPSRAGAPEIGREVALKSLFRKRPAVTQQAQTDLTVDDDRAATDRVALRTGQRLRNRIFRARDTDRATDGDERRRPPTRPAHPKTSPVIVRNQASASTASAARVARGASAGLTPPAPGTSANWPPDGAYTPATEMP